MQQVVAFLVIITILVAAFFLWRRNRQRKQAAASKVSFVQQDASRDQPTEQEHMMVKTEDASAGGSVEVPAGARQEEGTVDVPPTYQMAVLDK